MDAAKREMDAAKREMWAGHVAKWRASGLSGRAFAAKNGINFSTLRWWSDRIRYAASEPKQLASPRRALAKSARPVAPPMTFVELTDVGDQIEVVLPSGVRVRVRRGFDATTLLQVLDVLRG